jgi:flagellar biosynthesis/type III secretory pathway protein FliH
VLSEVRGARRIELHVNPADLVVLEAQLSKPSALDGLTFVANAACGRGNFRVVTDVGTMDAEVGERLDLLAAKLADTLRKGA